MLARILLLLTTGCVTTPPPSPAVFAVYDATMAARTRVSSYSALMGLRHHAADCLAALDRAAPGADAEAKWPTASGEKTLKEMRVACEKAQRLEGVKTAFEACTKTTLAVTQNNATAATSIEPMGKTELHDCGSAPSAASVPASYKPIESQIRQACAGGVALPKADLWTAGAASRTATFVCWKKERRERWTTADLP